VPLSTGPSARQAPTSGRFDETRRSLALEHAAGRIDDDTHLARAASLRAEAERASRDSRPVRAAIPVDRAAAKLHSIHETWKHATPQGQAELLNSIYERIVVRGEEILRVRLTPDAYAQGLATALPQDVELAPEWVLARPTGVGHALATYRIPLEGRDEWLAAAEARSA